MTALALDRDRLIRDYLPLLRAEAVRMSAHLGWHYEPEELIADGYRGLAGAAKRYDPALNSSFGIYARTCIRGAMLDGARRDALTTRRDRRLNRQMDIARYRFAAREGWLPTARELADELGWPHRELDAVQVRMVRSATVSLDEHAPETDVLTVETIVDPDADPSRDLFARVRHDQLTAMIATLGDRERMVISLRFWEECTHREIAAMLGVSESRVCQIAAAALRKLRAAAPEDLRTAA